MSAPTEAQHAWVLDLLHVDPRSYESGAQGAHADGVKPNGVAAVASAGGAAPTAEEQQRAKEKAEQDKAAADLATNTKILRANSAYAPGALADLKKHKAKAVVSAEIADLEKSLADAKALEASGQILPAARVYWTVISGVSQATKIADASVAYDTALVAANARAARCKVAVDALSPPAPPVSSAFQSMQLDTIETAKSKIATREYGAAVELLKTVDARCTAVEALVGEHKTYLAALTAATDAVAKLNQPVVAAEAKRIDSERVAPAKAAAASGDYKSAGALLAKAVEECVAAAKILAGHDEAAKARAGAQPALDAAGAELPKAIEAVQKLADALLAHPQAAAIKDMSDEITAAIAYAKAQPAPADAKPRLTKAADLCVDARVAADGSAAYAPKLAAAESAVAALVSKVIEKEKARIQAERIDAAKQLVQPPARDFAKADSLLDMAVTECAAATETVKQEALYQKALVTAQATLDALGAIKPTKDPVIGDDALAIQKDPIDSTKLVVEIGAMGYERAIKLLAPVKTSCDALKLKKKMASTTPPTKDEIAALVKEPGGTEKLDKIVAALPDNADTKLMQTAIQARFGLKSFENMDKSGGAAPGGISGTKSLKKVYDLMAKVPPSHTQNNPSLQDIEIHGGAAEDPENDKRGSFYAGDKKKVVLSCGRAGDETLQPLDRRKDALLWAGDPKVSGVEPDCDMVPDTPEAPAPKYFDWTTLHEVGHAVDDRKGFMSANGKGSAFGGWQEHGGDSYPVARAIAKQTAFKGPEAEKYLADYLAGSAGPPPAAPPGTANWDDVKKAAEKWCDEIRVGASLWDNGSGSAAHAIDGRVYHEAYAGIWVSYEVGARRKGITGYQFRAPGEWFSELYAAYHCNKLKKSHPSISWLAAL